MRIKWVKIRTVHLIVPGTQVLGKYQPLLLMSLLFSHMSIPCSVQHFSIGSRLPHPQACCLPQSHPHPHFPLLRDNIFTPTHGSREKASKIMVVLTDGDIFEDPLDLTTVINSPKMQGVERFAIGVRASRRGQFLTLCSPGWGGARVPGWGFCEWLTHTLFCSHSPTSFLPVPMSRASRPRPTGSSRRRLISQCALGLHASSDGESLWEPTGRTLGLGEGWSWRRWC